MRPPERLLAWWRRLRPERSLGERGEIAAARFLRRLGYHIIARRHRNPLGEIDLVAVDGRMVVFVEVKTRRSAAAGHPHDAVDPAKQRRLSRLALAFLERLRPVGLLLPVRRRRRHLAAGSAPALDRALPARFRVDAVSPVEFTAPPAKRILGARPLHLIRRALTMTEHC